MVRQGRIQAAGEGYAWISSCERTLDQAHTLFPCNQPRASVSSFILNN